jgi:hypothetical protein
MAVLMIDTAEDLADVLDRLFKIMRPILEEAHAPPFHTWEPDRPFTRPQQGHPGVSFGHFLEQHLHLLLLVVGLGVHLAERLEIAFGITVADRLVCQVTQIY